LHHRDARAVRPSWRSFAARRRGVGVVVAALFALTAARAASAATCTWQGSGSGTGARFARAANWSCFAVPGGSDDVYFDGSGGTNRACTLNAALNVRSITFRNGYTATVSAGTTTVTAGSWSMSSGTFTGSSGAVTITGDLSIGSGASFTASSTTTQIGGSFTNAGAFTANGGTVSLVRTSSGGTITSGGYSFSALTINGSGGTYTLQDALTTTGTLTVTAGTLVTGSQSVSLGGLTINGGTFNAPTGTLTLSGAFNRSSGTFTANGGTVYFAGTSTLSHTFGGSTMANVQVGLGTSGLVGYWKLDETSGTTAADSSGNGNTGTYNTSGVTHPSSVPSSISFSDPRAVTLDGSSGYVTLGTTNFPANNAPQTISLWFQGTPNAATNQNMLAMANSSTGSAIQLGFRGTSLVVWGWGGGALVSTTAPTDGAWHQVIYTYDGVTDSLYLDGTAVSTSTTAVHQTGSPTNAYLGTYSPNSEMWNGSLDDVRVYNRALTTPEIALLAGGSSPSTVAGTHTFSDAFACTGDFSILAGTVTGSSTFSVGGDWFNGGTFSSTGQVTLTGSSSAATITTGGRSFGALKLSGTGTYTLEDDLAVTGDLTISAGKLSGSKNVTVGGSFSNAGVYGVSGSLTLTSTSTAAKITSGGARFGSLTINGAGGTYTLQDRLWVPGGTITLTNGTLAAGANVIHAGGFSVGSGTFSGGTGTLVLDGSADTTLPVSSVASLRVEDPTENDLVGYWKLDEATGTTVQDVSGNGNNGTLSSSGATWQTSSGPAVTYDDYAYLTLDGSAGYASLGVNNLPAINAAITISAWVKINNTSGNQNIVALTGGGGNLQLGLRGGSYVAWPSGATTTVTGPAATTGAWHHLAYTYDGSSTDIIYVDGTAYSGSFTHQSGATTAAYIGTFSPNNEMFNGSVDDVRIYDVALTAAQIAQLAAGRYAGTGGTATVTLGANTTVSSLLALDDGSLNAAGKTLSATSTTTAALVNTGTYTVGSAAQSFSGGLTVNPNGTLALTSSGGSVKIGSGKTLTVDGTLKASSTGATIQSVSGTYTFKVGSTSSATPTLNVSGLAVKGTSGGMQIGASTSATTTFTEFDNVAFSGGTGAQYLLINAKSLFLSSNGCSFDAGQTTGGPTVAVKLAGNGTGDGETRAIFGGTTCAANWYVSASDTSCGTAAKSDDETAANDGATTQNASTNGAVVQFVRAAQTDTAGSVIGFPTAAFDWNTFTYYSTYAAFHDASGGTSDTIYVRDAAGNALYSWTVPTAGETITGTPQWITSSSKHYVYVATTQGHVYRLVDTGTGTTSGTLSLDSSGAWSTNPFDCGCTISTPLAMDASNLYWGSTTSGENFWTLGQSNESNPLPVAITPTVTSAGLSIATISGTSYAFMGVTGNFLKISTLAQSITATNNSPGSTHAIKGRVVVGYNKSGTWRAYGGDDGGTMWALDPGSGFSTANGLWHYTAASAIESSPYYDHDTDTVQFGTDGGAIVCLNASTGAALNAGYPYTPSGGSGDPITAAPLYYGGILVVGSTGGKLYFLDRNTGSGVSLLKEYNFGSGESVSGVGYNATVNRFMVTTANSSTKDGRLYYFDLLSDPTSGSK
jgi:hypothetical protein